MFCSTRIADVNNWCQNKSDLKDVLGKEREICCCGLLAEMYVLSKMLTIWFFSLKFYDENQH